MRAERNQRLGVFTVVGKLLERELEPEPPRPECMHGTCLWPGTSWLPGASAPRRKLKLLLVIRVTRVQQLDSSTPTPSLSLAGVIPTQAASPPFLLPPRRHGPLGSAQLPSRPPRACPDPITCPILSIQVARAVGKNPRWPPVVP